MKKISYLCSLLFGCALAHAAEPIENHIWNAKSGHKLKATALKVEDGEVHLRNEDGKTVKVTLDRLSDDDQEKLRKHFEISDEVAKGEGSGANAAEGLPHPLGQVSGPVDAGEGSTYLVYLPKSLKEGRLAPLLFYTDSGGGNTNHIDSLKEYAEIFGWVLAVSVQSKNADGWEKNSQNSRNALEHILGNLPVDEERLHYTGNSGGGAQAFINSGIKRAYGVMPNIGYIPSETNEKTTVVYGLGGGRDYNRYLTAHAAEKYKKKGFHRMSSLGHGPAPAEHRGDGMFWMHCHFLGKEKSSYADEAKDFELATLDWLEKLKTSHSQRAYSNAVFFKEIYEPSGTNGAALEKLIKELTQTPENVLYHEGLLAIDEFSRKHFAPLGEGGGSSFNHSSPKIVKAVEKLKEAYGHIKELEGVIKAMGEQTVGQ